MKKWIKYELNLMFFIFSCFYFIFNLPEHIDLTYFQGSLFPGIYQSFLLPSNAIEYTTHHYYTASQLENQFGLWVNWSTVFGLIWVSYFLGLIPFDLGSRTNSTKTKLNIAFNLKYMRDERSSFLIYKVI